MTAVSSPSASPPLASLDAAPLFRFGRLVATGRAGRRDHRHPRSGRRRCVPHCGIDPGGRRNNPAGAAQVRTAGSACRRQGGLIGAPDVGKSGRSETGERRRNETNSMHSCLRVTFSLLKANTVLGNLTSEPNTRRVDTPVIGARAANQAQRRAGAARRLRPLLDAELAADRIQSGSEWARVG